MPRFTSVEVLKTGYLDVERDVNDELLAGLLGSAENLFELGTRRSFVPDPALTGDPPSDTAPPVVRRLSTGGLERFGAIHIPLPDVRQVTSLNILGRTVAAASAAGVYPLDGYELVYRRPGEPATGVLVPRSYSGRRDCDDRGGLVVTGRFGFLEAPDDVKDAVYLIAAKAYRERSASYAETIETEAGILTYFRGLPGRAWTTYQLRRRRTLL